MPGKEGNLPAWQERARNLDSVKNDGWRTTKYYRLRARKEKLGGSWANIFLVDRRRHTIDLAIHGHYRNRRRPSKKPNDI